MNRIVSFGAKRQESYLCIQNRGSRYLNPSRGPREQPVTNLKEAKIQGYFCLQQIEDKINEGKMEKRLAMLLGKTLDHYSRIQLAQQSSQYHLKCTFCDALNCTWPDRHPSQSYKTEKRTDAAMQEEKPLSRMLKSATYWGKFYKDQKSVKLLKKLAQPQEKYFNQIHSASIIWQKQHLY